MIQAQQTSETRHKEGLFTRSGNTCGHKELSSKTGPDSPAASSHSTASSGTNKADLSWF